MTAKQRDHSLDLMKGLLVLLMTWGHVMQFFGDHQLFPVMDRLEIGINLLVFPGFVFAFGWAVAIAYYSRPFQKAWRGMLSAALKPLGAFYLSGIAFRVLRENRPFSWGVVRRILLLQDVPGWSEFLASFFALALLALALYWPLKRLKDRPLWLLPLGAALLALCFIPYASIKNPLLRLYLGTDAYASFPVLQYSPYFLAGLAWPGLKTKNWGRFSLPALALLGTLGGWWRGHALGALPQRFPPDVGWILLPAAGVAVLAGLGFLLSLLPTRLRLDACRPLRSLGANSLYYLLAGNLALFTLAGKGVAPKLQFKTWGLFGQPIMAPAGAFWWALALLAAAAFVTGLIRKVRR